MPRIFEAPPGFVLHPDYLVPELRAQRDLLLEALKRAEPLLIGPILLQARAAIKAVEEQK
jgi:hypothetical protein